MTETIAALALVLIAAFAGIAEWVKAALMLLAAVMIFTVSFIAVGIEQKAGYYECIACGFKYKPTYLQVLMAPHRGRNRKMICPHCGKRNYHKKVISNE